MDGAGVLNLIPVALKEASLDSPSARASVNHFSDQVDLVEKWLEEYLKSTNRLLAESSTLESILTNFTAHAMLPTSISESIIDHDYTILAMKKYADAAKDYWMSMIGVIKRLSTLVVEPIRAFVQNDLRAFKDLKKNLDATQKTFDNLQNKFFAVGKSKEASSLREDAFQLHEARKAYLKASMDYFVSAPQLRNSLDKLLVKVFYDQFREMRNSRENSSSSFVKNASEMERVRGWAKEMEQSEKSFRKELLAARKQLEETAESATRPSRELEDYSLSTVPNIGPQHGRSISSVFAPKSPKKGGPSKPEKQGWLFLRTYAGKPVRTSWVRKWAYVRTGIFGWLVQGQRAGGVEESERIGVLLCNVKAAMTEDRRFCFEVKTKNTTILLQAETQNELIEWISVFETAKSKALEDPTSSSMAMSSKSPQTDPAFAISAPPISEFGTIVLDSLNPSRNEDAAGTERSSTLPLPGVENAKEDSDVSRRSTGLESEEPSSRSRLRAKLDIHRKSTAGVSGPSPATPTATGGIASLIAASHGSMPVGPSVPIVQRDGDLQTPRITFTLPTRDMPSSTLAPSTLANPPLSTGLTKAAVLVIGERNVNTDADKTAPIPSGVLANIWGSNDWTYTKRLEEKETRTRENSSDRGLPSPLVLPEARSPPRRPMSQLADDTTVSALNLSTIPPLTSRSREPSPTKRHRNTINYDSDSAVKARSQLALAPQAGSRYPNYYPLQLKTQDAQFRLLFPHVRPDERLVLVFRATWCAADAQEFPGRTYVTDKSIYFYSNHFGLVFTSLTKLASIDEVTAAPGRDCDFVFVHLQQPTEGVQNSRITLKVFLEPLKLLQRRLNLMLRNNNLDEPRNLETVIKALIKLESDNPEKSPSLESWEDLSFDSPAPGSASRRLRGRSLNTENRPLRFDTTVRSPTSISSPAAAKFKLPAQPVVYVPPGSVRLAADQIYEISPKALFHILFGDRSAVWQLLQHERQAKDLTQSPWKSMGEGHMRRDFHYNIPTVSWFGRAIDISVNDYQTVDVSNDHLCYVVTDKRTPWHLPFRHNYRLVSKIVITHTAKAKCKLAIYTKVEWHRKPAVPFLQPAIRSMIESQAVSDLSLDALDLVDVVSDQVRKLGSHIRTNRAIQIFGHLGQSTNITYLQVDALNHSIELRRQLKQQTLLSLLASVVASAVETTLTTIVMGFVDISKWTYKTMAAERILLAILIAQGLFIIWKTGGDSLEHYAERKSANFMKRLGVSPKIVTSKAVYIADLDDQLARTGVLPSLDERGSCYSLFHEVNMLTDVHAPLHSLAMTSAYDEGRATTSRIQKTRQRLGRHRHDLMLAIKVVNNIERDVVQAEWSHWLDGEVGHCNEVEILLQKNETTNLSDTNSGPADQSFDLQAWHNDYCVNCKVEKERLTSQ